MKHREKSSGYHPPRSQMAVAGSRHPMFRAYHSKRQRTEQFRIFLGELSINRPMYMGSGHDGPLAAGYGPNDQKRLGPGRDRVRQWGVRRLMGQVLLAGEEPQERSALLGD